MIRASFIALALSLAGCGFDDVMRQVGSDFKGTTTQPSQPEKEKDE